MITRRTGLLKEGVVRQRINGYNPKDKPPPDYKPLTRELNAIGNNINRIARVANMSGVVDAKFYREQITRLDEAILKINEAVTAPERIIYGNNEYMEH